MKESISFKVVCCALTIFLTSEAASRDEELIQFNFGVDRYHQLAGTINIGYLSLGGGARLPVQLQHYVQKTLYGDISMFSISPIETYLTVHPSAPDGFLWRSPLGRTVAIPQPRLGFYAADNVSYRFTNDCCTIGLSDACSLVYRAGLLQQLVLPDGTIIDCETNGRNLTALRRGNYIYLKTSRDHDSVTIFGNGEEASKVTFQFKFNRYGQVVSFDSPNGTGTIKYDTQGLISGAYSTQNDVVIKRTAVAFWDYKKRQLGLDREWSVNAKPICRGSVDSATARASNINSGN